MSSTLRADQAEPSASHGSGNPSSVAIGGSNGGGNPRLTANADPLSTASLLSGQPTAPAASFSSGPPVVAAHAFTRAGSRPADEWREEEFQHVTVIDGRTLEAGGRRIRLVGLDLPVAEQMCRTLDGRVELCTSRAATQLELLTRSRRLTCLYRVEATDETIGRCRLGTRDLTERMIKTGYAWPSAALPRGSES
jgi:endonuclease YncB( thermonuclease family)